MTQRVREADRRKRKEHKARGKSRYILCKINLAIILYGSVNPHKICHFIFKYRDRSADHPTTISTCI